MKKLLVLLMCMLMLTVSFGCTAEQKTGSKDDNIPDATTETNPSGEETPTGWQTVIEGRYLKGKSSHLIIYEGGPVELRTKDESIFDDLTDGDLIWVGCQYIEESYPGGTDVLGIEKIRDGEYADLNTDVLAMLYELGWIEYITIEDEAEELTGYYYETDKGQWLLVDGDSYYIYPHPDMISDVEVLFGYTDGDLISITCETEIEDEFKSAKVWSSKLIEEGTPENLGIGEE